MKKKILYQAGDVIYGEEQAVGVYKRIRAVREILYMRQRDFAISLGISDGTYYNIENGKRNPPIGILYLLSTIYDVDVEYLLHGTGEMFKKRGGRRDIDSEPPEDIVTHKDVMWYLEYSPVFRAAITATAADYFYEHRERVQENAADFRERKSKKKVTESGVIPRRPAMRAAAARKKKEKAKALEQEQEQEHGQEE